MKNISERILHHGEMGRNNEAILREFLIQHLPMRYTVSTGKVVSVGGKDSYQVDLIIHDRLETPAFVDAHEWKLVPIESVQAVISVKTTLTKPELRDAMESIRSVRSLERRAATLPESKKSPIPTDQVLRPRAFVFAFKSAWSSLDGCENAFVDLLNEVEDTNRPNGVCTLDQGFIVRRPFTTEVVSYVEHALMHFFVYLVKSLDSRPRYRVDLAKYFTEDYGETRGV